jgi:outer membrane protein TolC
MLKANISEMSILREKLRFVPEIAAFANYGVIGQNNNFKFTDASQKWYQSGALGVTLSDAGICRWDQILQCRKGKAQPPDSRISNLQNTRIKTAKEDQDLVLDFVKAKNDLQARQKQLAISERNYSLALIKYKNESMTYDNLVNVQNEMLTAQQQILQSEADYVISQYKIKLINSYDKK